MHASTTTNNQQPTTDDQHASGGGPPCRDGGAECSPHPPSRVKICTWLQRRPFSGSLGQDRSWPRVAVAGHPIWAPPRVRPWVRPRDLYRDTGQQSLLCRQGEGCGGGKAVRRIIDKVMDFSVNKVVMNLVVPTLPDDPRKCILSSPRRRRIERVETARAVCLGRLGGEEYPHFQCKASVECTVHGRRFGCSICPRGRHGEVQATVGS